MTSSFCSLSNIFKWQLKALVQDMQGRMADLKNPNLIQKIDTLDLQDGLSSIFTFKALNFFERSVDFFQLRCQSDYG